MFKIIPFIVIALSITGCASGYYGYSEKEWAQLSEKQKNEAMENIKLLNDQQQTRQMSNKFIDDVFGSRSNQFIINRAP